MGLYEAQRVGDLAAGVPRPSLFYLLDGCLPSLGVDENELEKREDNLLSPKDTFQQSINSAEN